MNLLQMTQEERTWILAELEERHGHGPLEDLGIDGKVRCTVCDFYLTESDLIRWAMGRPAYMEQPEEVREAKRQEWLALRTKD